MFESVTKVSHGTVDQAIKQQAREVVPRNALSASRTQGGMSTENVWQLSPAIATEESCSGESLGLGALLTGSDLPHAALPPSGRE